MAGTCRFGVAFRWGMSGSNPFLKVNRGCEAPSPEYNAFKNRDAGTVCSGISAGIAVTACAMRRHRRLSPTNSLCQENRDFRGLVPGGKMPSSRGPVTI